MGIDELMLQIYALIHCRGSALLLNFELNYSSS